MALQLSVVTADDSSAMKQDEAPEDVHGCNVPALRRNCILHSLLKSEMAVEVIEVTSSSHPTSLDLARCCHDHGFVDYLETAWERWTQLEHKDVHMCRGGGSEEGGVIPSLIPTNSVNHGDSCQRPGKGVASQTNFYCTDTEVPIFEALKPALISDMAVVRKCLDIFNPKEGAAAAAAAAASSSEKETVACSAMYCLITHPGHHASISNCQGYCYINSAAIIADRLREEHPILQRKVAILDIDYHAGNGSIGIFWKDPEIFVASIHGDPEIEYPYTCGFADQIGGENALGKTLCVPLPQGSTYDEHYEAALDKCIDGIIQHGAQALVVSLGVDTLDNDPVAVVGAGFKIQLKDYVKIGQKIRSRLSLPTIFVQEGGYDLTRLGEAVTNTLSGFCAVPGSLSHDDEDL
jgi:acetoin utilization deacetylase AcuC-like enzyme